jgi:phosphoserine phosphatase RsbU/P
MISTSDSAELARRVDSLHRLLEVSRSLAAEVDLDRILSTITREACHALDCDRATIYQYDSEAAELYTRIATELEVASIRKPLSQGISGMVAAERVIANVSDPAADPRWDSSIDAATGYHTRNILAAPLIAPHDGSLLGVLQLLNKQGGSFDAIDEELLVAFGQHAAVSLDRARMIEEIKGQQATQASLNVAREIQRGFMPRELPVIPGYEVASWWYPNEAVGGDYCDVLKLQDGRTGLVIADVSGHGLGPALLMASVRAALRALTLDHSSSEVLLNLLGRSLGDDLQDGRFITIVLAALDAKAHRLEYANAGHAPALYYRASSDEFAQLESTGLPLGVLERPEYPQGPPLQLVPGDLLILCTDGIVEAMDADYKQFGVARLQHIVRTYKSESVAQMVEHIGAEVTQHYVGDSPPDDLTILALRRNQ